MEQTSYNYLMWPKQKLDSNWEEQAFAEDAAGALGGCVWPPRFYTCNFCRREFRSAQALGGHMNVHRRDRARLKQSLPDNNGSNNNDNTLAPSVSQWDKTCTLVYKPDPDSGCERYFHLLDFDVENNNRNKNKNKRNCSRFLEDLKENKKKKSFDDDDERVIILESRCSDDVAGNCHKRRRIIVDDDDDDKNSNMFGYDPKPCLVERWIKQPQVMIQTTHSSIEELDLELRLGSPPKVK